MHFLTLWEVSGLNALIESSQLAVWERNVSLKRGNKSHYFCVMCGMNKSNKFYFSGSLDWTVCFWLRKTFIANSLIAASVMITYHWKDL